MSVKVPTAPLREALDGYLLETTDEAWFGSEQRTSTGVWEHIASVMGYTDGQSASGTVRALLSRHEFLEYYPQTPDFDPVRFADTLLTAIGRHELFDELVPREQVAPDYVEELRWCVCCGRLLEMCPAILVERRELASHDVVLPSRHKRWFVCGPCYAGWHPDELRQDCTGNKGVNTQRFRKIPPVDVGRLYVRYCTELISGREIVEQEQVVERFGYANDVSAENSMMYLFRRAGWPTRTPAQGKRVAYRGRQQRGEGMFGNFTAGELRKLHVLHVRGEKLSANELAKRLYVEKGYKTHVSCQAAILTGWKQLGMKARDRIEMCVAMSTKNGDSPRDWQERKRLRKARDRQLKDEGKTGINMHGRPRQPHCLGTSQKTGLRCTRPSMPSGYCYVHDPEKAAERDANLTRMRARSPHLQYADWPGWQDELRYACELVGKQAVADALGVSFGTVKSALTPKAARHYRFSQTRAAKWQQAIAELTRPNEEEAA